MSNDTDIHEELVKELTILKKTINKLQKKVYKIERMLLTQNIEPRENYEIPISPNTAKILKYLMDNGPRTQSQIINDLKLPKSTVSYSLKRLKEMNLIESRRIPRYDSRFEYNAKNNLPNNILEFLSRLEK
ncbi:MAG: winged helix-turn-helix domain-containing protein [Candidatus Aenigmatarchaeota archaeon]